MRFEKREYAGKDNKEFYEVVSVGAKAIKVATRQGIKSCKLFIEDNTYHAKIGNDFIRADNVA